MINQERRRWLEVKEIKLKLHPCYCGGEMEIKKVAQNGGMDGSYWDWKLTCNKCGLIKYYAADGFYGRQYKTFEEVVDDWNRKIIGFDKRINIEEFIKKNYAPVDNKPGYVWFNKRNFEIIKIETLAKSLKDYLIKDGGLNNAILRYLQKTDIRKSSIEFRYEERGDE